MIYRVKISYFGKQYSGWQRQINAMTVQQRLEEGLAKTFDQEIRVTGAGRTDSGVHARGQVAHFATESSIAVGALVHAVNHDLPRDIRIVAAERMGGEFHARRDARSKLYSYRVVRVRTMDPVETPFAHNIAGPFDDEALSEATAMLRGTHDFSAFTVAGGAHTHPRRTVFYAGWVSDGAVRELRIRGNGFLRGMVRGLAGTLLEVARGQRSPAAFGQLLSGRTRSEAGPTAPARGLTLEQVEYDEPF